MKNYPLIILTLFTLCIFVSSCSDDEVACTESTWYEDADADGLGNPDSSQSSCTQPEGYVADNTDTDDNGGTSGATDVVIDVNPALFLSDAANLTITTISCTLSDGSTSTCYQIETKGTPTDHQLGPWCPNNISDGAEAGGIWLEGGEVYDVDGAFIENMATFYGDNRWQMYDANGDIYTTETLEDCENAANPQVGVEYENFCVECLPAYITELTNTIIIPASPVKLETTYDFPMGPGGGNGPSQRGVAFNGTPFDAPAPTDAILGAYTIAPFDDAGGHINPNAGYHYHAANGLSTEVAQSDDHAPMIGYAMDGFAIYARLDVNGEESTDLDQCRGHYDDIRGYHYHVDYAGTNNFLNCLSGAYAN